MSDTEVLILSELACWPLDHGGRLRVAHLAWALQRMGVSVRFASPAGVPEDAPESLKSMAAVWPESDTQMEKAFLAGWKGVWGPLRRRLARHQGIDTRQYAGALELVERYQPRAVIGIGQHAPLMLHGLPQDLPRIWYAADDVVAFLLSCMWRESWSRWPSRLYGAALHAGLEIAFGGLDGIVGVSEADQKYLSTLGRPKIGRVIPNGVDLDVFRPEWTQKVEPQSAVFWGRLDFEPNVDGLLWFVREVWPELRSRYEGASFRVIGRGSHPNLKAIEGVPGVEFLGAVDDVRPHAWGAAVTVLPMRCGGGIKNKLLEALALGRPVVCTEKALTGLPMDHRMPPVRLSRDARGLASAITRLWDNPMTARQLGVQGRAWAERHASWDRTARHFMRMIQACEGADGARSENPPLPRAA